MRSKAREVKNAGPERERRRNRGRLGCAEPEQRRAGGYPAIRPFSGAASRTSSRVTAMLTRFLPESLAE